MVWSAPYFALVAVHFIAGYGHSFAIGVLTSFGRFSPKTYKSIVSDNLQPTPAVGFCTFNSVSNPRPLPAFASPHPPIRPRPTNGVGWRSALWSRSIAARCIAGAKPFFQNYEAFRVKSRRKDAIVSIALLPLVGMSAPPSAIAEVTGYGTAELEAFMRAALNEAAVAHSAGEVPVGCVFVDAINKVILAGAGNETNQSRNGCRHCELVAIDAILHSRHQARGNRAMADVDLFVTCEPCIMCTAAIQLCGVRRVFYGCPNDRFGGCGSVLSLHEGVAVKGLPGLKCYGGILADDAIAILQTFYSRGNPRVPEAKRHRPLAGDQ
eukprot:GHVT01081599.1.p2 GENE.GHVT01081599.1~~GHVT01081599.1.p2  ORF type:complete len:323 (+),score=21.45 GHVT01081599.1:3163-4131(+)